MSVPCIFNPRNLQHEFSRHAAVFGVAGQWNTENAELFKQAIQNHLASAPQQILGTYRGTTAVIHYYDPVSLLWAAVDGTNVFQAGWRLTLIQQVCLLATGNVQ